MTKGRVDSKHFSFIRSLPCVTCNANQPCEVSHIRLGTDGGTGLKPSPYYTVPQCDKCHKLLHKGERTFWGNSLEDAQLLAKQLYNNTGDWKACVSLILYFRRKYASLCNKK